MTINKSYAFGAYNNSPWDTRSLVTFSVIGRGKDDTSQRIRSQLRENRGLLRYLAQHELKLADPISLKIARSDRDVVIDAGQEWRQKFGPLLPEEVKQQEPKLVREFTKGSRDEPHVDQIDIGHGSAKRYFATVDDEKDNANGRAFHVLLVEHHAFTNEKKRGELIGELVFVFVPTFDPLKYEPLK